MYSLGSGLGRIVFNFASMGYGAQGNEYSFFMLLASNFVLNMINKNEEFEIYPFIHNYSNTFEEEDPVRLYKIPDVNPAECIPKDADFSMVAGEFIEVYKNQLSIKC